MQRQAHRRHHEHDAHGGQAERTHREERDRGHHDSAAAAQRAPRDAQGGDEHESHHRRAQAAQQEGGGAAEGAVQVEPGRAHQDDRARQHDGEEAPDPARHAGEPVAQGHREIAEVGAGQHLAQREVLNELVVADPAAAPHERVVEVGAPATAEAREAGPGEDRDQAEEGDAPHSQRSSEWASGIAPECSTLSPGTRGRGRGAEAGYEISSASPDDGAG